MGAASSVILVQLGFEFGLVRSCLLRGRRWTVHFRFSGDFRGHSLVVNVSDYVDSTLGGVHV